MPLVDRLYDWLLQGPAPDCDRIVDAALPQAEAGWFTRMTALLLRRGRDASWAALIGQFERLPSEVRRLFSQPNDDMQGGIALAAKSSSAETRVNALRALELVPSARMAYLLPVAICDPSRTVRDLAAALCRQMADCFLNQPVPAADSSEDLRRSYADQRQQLVLALEEALQTLQVHNRIEVAEASLWFSRHMRQSLWSKLTNQRSHVGRVVREHLPEWDHPRLAHFLLSALIRPAWRRSAAQVLRGWSTIPEITALLRQDDLLENPAIRQRLGTIHGPQWFTQTDDDLTQLEPHLRRRAPRWVCHAGYTDVERVELFSRWVRARDVELHNAVVYALPRIETPDAARLLKEVGHGDTQEASFARWSTEAFDTAAVSAALDKEMPALAQPDLDAEPERTAREQSAADCAMLWEACRRTAPAARGELIAALRETAPAWEAHLRSYLQSSDPRDRVLALHVISVRPLTHRFRADIEPMQNDSLEGIRRLVQRLMQMLAQEPESEPNAGPIASTDDGVPPDPEAVERARRELPAILKRLASGEADATDGDLIARVRGLLREAYAGQPEVQPLASLGEEG